MDVDLLSLQGAYGAAPLPLCRTRGPFRLLAPTGPHTLQHSPQARPLYPTRSTMGCEVGRSDCLSTSFLSRASDVSICAAALNDSDRLSLFPPISSPTSNHDHRTYSATAKMRARSVAATTTGVARVADAELDDVYKAGLAYIASGQDGSPQI